MIQDIQPHVYHNEYHPAQPKPDDIVFCFDEQDYFLKKDHTLYRIKDLSSTDNLYWLFKIDDTQFFLSAAPEPDAIREKVRNLRSFEPGYLGFAAITAWQIDTWRKENTYCGKCGHRMQDDTVERAIRCPGCGHIVYPRINPAVIVGVINDKNQILVTKYAHSAYNRYALIAGFTEIGETIEETVKREVKEEAGIEVTDLQYYKCQPWSFSSTLLFGFWCRVSGDDTIHIDEKELKAGKWADREEDIGMPDGTSLTGEMIQMFKAGKAFQKADQ